MKIFILRLIKNLLNMAFKNIWHMELVNKELIPGKGPLIVVANHRSLLDGPILYSIFDINTVYYMVAAYIFDIPVIGAILRITNTIPAYKKDLTGVKKTLNKAVEVLNKEGILVIFPEGGVKTGDRIEKIESGASYLAIKTHSQILPVYIAGSLDIMPKGSFFPGKGRITVYFGDLIDVENDKNKMNEIIIEKLNHMSIQLNKSKNK